MPSARAWSASPTAGATTCPGVELSVAWRYAGVNDNPLSDEDLIDPVSGNAVLNGIPVEVAQAG